MDDDGAWTLITAQDMAFAHEENVSIENQIPVCAHDSAFIAGVILMAGFESYPWSKSANCDG